jgi:GT2 family glycosyltransferase
MGFPETATAIVLTYKRPDELTGVLSNLTNQHHVPEQILVIDNDPEQSGRKARYLDEPTVQYVCPGENLGVAGGRNYAAQIALGDVLIFLGDDCRFESFNSVQRIIDSFNSKELAALAFLMRNFYTKEVLPREYPGFKTENWPVPHDVCHFLGGACAIRRDMFEELGGYDDVLVDGGEEVEFGFRLLKTGRRIYYQPDMVVFHREPEGYVPAQDVFRLIRNHVYIAYKHMPAPYLFSHLAYWGWQALTLALRSGQFSEFTRGLQSVKGEGLLDQALAYRKTDPMPPEIVKYLQDHEGRLNY